MDNPLGGEAKCYTNGPGHMTKMAATLIYGQTLQNCILWNQRANDLGYCMCLIPWHHIIPKSILWKNTVNVNPEIFARNLFSRIALKDIFATLKIRD